MDDLPRERRRWWFPWAKTDAATEWRELTLFAAKLRQVEEDIRSIVRGMEAGVAGTPIAGTAGKYARLARRWERRASRARADAQDDHEGDEDWGRRYEQVMRDDLAEDLMARGLNALIAAERHLDEKTRGRARIHREALQNIYAEVHDRDLGRRLRAESDY